MKRMHALIGILLVFVLAVPVQAQDTGYRELDGNPYDPTVEPHADMFISHWKHSMPRHEHGSLIVRDIITPLTSSDPMKPDRPGAVATIIKRLSYATLEPLAVTTKDKLAGEQNIIYIDSGKGVIKTRRTTQELREGIIFLIPEGLEFTIENTCGINELTMYVIVEPVPEGFKPKKDIVVKDEKADPLGGTTGHWTHITKTVFRPEDGLASLTGLCPVWYDPMTMGQPHSHTVGTEEIWFAVKGDIHLLLGKQFRDLPVGSAYKIPPNSMTPHSNVNASDKPIKMFWMMYNAGGEKPEFADLDPQPFDPATEPNIDMFMGSYMESNPFHTHGSLLERNVLTPLEGDPLAPTARGAVLEYVNRFTHASLMAGNTTTPYSPEGEQELFYVISGEGTVTGGGETFDLFPGVTVLVPAGLEFTMTNTGTDALNMYLVVEPTPPGFRPNDYIFWNSERDTQTWISDSHWINTWEHLITPEDGLAQMQLVLSVWLYPNTFAQPHSHNETTEEVWATLKGDVKFLMGKQMRDLPYGMAHKIPPNNAVPHANFNITEEPIKLFYFARFEDREPRP